MGGGKPIALPIVRKGLRNIRVDNIENEMKSFNIILKNNMFDDFGERLKKVHFTRENGI